METQQSRVPLHMLPLGSVGHVAALLPDAQARRRLIDLGIVDGTEICPLYRSPSGNPKAYLVRGAVIALRTDTAEKILITQN